MIEDIIKAGRISSNGRRYFTSDQKSLIIKEWDSSGLSAPEFCRRYGLIVTVLYNWRRNAYRGAAMGIQHDGDLHSRTELDLVQRENEELKKALGEAHLDIKILKKKLEMDALKQRLQKSNGSAENLK